MPQTQRKQRVPQRWPLVCLGEQMQDFSSPYHGLVCRGLAAAGQPCPAGQPMPMPMCVSCCACHAVIDGGCRQGKPSGLRSLPCSRQQNTISIQQRHCDFFFHLMPCLCSLSFSFAFVMELDRLQVMPILPNTCTLCLEKKCLRLVREKVCVLTL